MHVTLSEPAVGVTPEAALGWWSDFREGRHDHPFVPAQTRRVLARTAEGVTMEDALELGGARFFRERTTARRESDRVTFEGENAFARFRGAYIFAPDAVGTRVRLEAEIMLRRALAPTELLARPVVRALLRADLRRHVDEMRRDLQSM